MIRHIRKDRVSCNFKHALKRVRISNFRFHGLRPQGGPLPKIDLNDFLRGIFGAKPHLKLSRLNNLLTFYSSRLRLNTFADVMIRLVR